MLGRIIWELECCDLEKKYGWNSMHSKYNWNYRILGEFYSCLYIYIKNYPTNTIITRMWAYVRNSCCLILVWIEDFSAYNLILHSSFYIIGNGCIFRNIVYRLNPWTLVTLFGKKVCGNSFLTPSIKVFPSDQLIFEDLDWPLKKIPWSMILFWTNGPSIEVLTRAS